MKLSYLCHQIGFYWTDLFGKRKAMEWINDSGDLNRVKGFVYRGIFYPDGQL